MLAPGRSARARAGYCTPSAGICGMEISLGLLPSFVCAAHRTGNLQVGPSHVEPYLTAQVAHGEPAQQRLRSLCHGKIDDIGNVFWYVLPLTEAITVFVLGLLLRVVKTHVPRVPCHTAVCCQTK